MNEIYSHRNGEAQRPEVEGYYWIQYPVHRDGVPVMTIEYWRDSNGYSGWQEEWYFQQDMYDGHPIYGPLVQPEVKLESASD